MYTMFLCVTDCGGAAYARDNSIPVISFPKTKDEPNGLSPNDLVAALRLDSFHLATMFFHIYCEPPRRTIAIKSIAYLVVIN